MLLVLLLPLRRRWLVPATALLATLLLIPMKLPLPMSRYFSTQDLSLTPPAVVRSIAGKSVSGPPSRVWGAYYRLELLASLCPNQNLTWGLGDVRLTSPVILDRFKIFSDHWNWNNLFGTYCFFPRQDPSLLSFLGVRWAVVDLGQPMKSLPPPADFSPLGLQENRETASWVRPAGRWVVASGDMDEWRKTFAAIRDGSWRDSAVLDAQPGIAAPGVSFRTPAVAWVEKGPNRWSWKVSGGDACVLQVLMNDHPNWRAAVDGNRVPVLGAYGTFMAVAVPAGDHTVTLVYREPWFWVGLWVSAAAWLTLVFWAVWAGRLSKRRAKDG